jgi:hypothetical protein
MECPSVATRGELPKHPTLEAELGFDYKVQQVVGHQRVVARSRVHDHIRQVRALRLYRVPPLAYASKDQFHVRFRVELPNVSGYRCAPIVRASV